MTAQETKAWIRELSDMYMREYYPSQFGELETTWNIFDELKLLEGDIEIREGESAATVGVSDLTEIVITGIVLGVISNAVYETLKYTTIRIAHALSDPEWQEEFINRMGNFRDEARDDALKVLKWALERILHKKETKSDG